MVDKMELEEREFFEGEEWGVESDLEIVEIKMFSNSTVKIIFSEEIEFDESRLHDTFSFKIQSDLEDQDFAYIPTNTETPILTN
jgi:hypothetical protein